MKTTGCSIRFPGVVPEAVEGLKMASALGSKKAAIQQNQNHGLLTVGPTIKAAAWWYIAMDKCGESAIARGGGRHARSLSLMRSPR
jgi:ribulose-5-phosphate 4-epimerase/fuculose-1-phosphate aldolase